MRQKKEKKKYQLGNQGNNSHEGQPSVPIVYKALVCASNDEEATLEEGAFDNDLALVRV